MKFIDAIVFGLFSVFALFFHSEIAATVILVLLSMANIGMILVCVTFVLVANNKHWINEQVSSVISDVRSNIAEGDTVFHGRIAAGVILGIAWGAYGRIDIALSFVMLELSKPVATWLFKRISSS